MKGFLLLLAYCTLQMTYAQSLDQHQWQDRILLVFTNDLVDETFQNQLQDLSKDESGLEERKLVVYSITPSQFSTDLQLNQWTSSSKDLQSYKKSAHSFEVVLIGLDGGVKLRQTELLPVEDLFALIDGMPMRRAELRRKKQ